MLETIENQNGHFAKLLFEQPIILWYGPCLSLCYYLFSSAVPVLLWYSTIWILSTDEPYHYDPIDSRLWHVLAHLGLFPIKFFNFGRLLLSRKIVLVVCLLMAHLGVGLAGTVIHSAASCLPSFVDVGLHTFNDYGAIWAIIQDVVQIPRRQRQRLIHLIGSVSGIVGPIVTGCCSLVNLTALVLPAYCRAWRPWCWS